MARNPEVLSFLLLEYKRVERFSLRRNWQFMGNCFGRHISRHRLYCAMGDVIVFIEQLANL